MSQLSFVRNSTARRSLNSQSRAGNPLSSGKSTDALLIDSPHPVTGQADTAGAVGLYPALLPTQLSSRSINQDVTDQNPNGWIPAEVHYKQKMRSGFIDLRNSYSEKIRPRYKTGYTPVREQGILPSSRTYHKDIKPYTSNRNLPSAEEQTNLYRSNSSLDLEAPSHLHIPFPHDMLRHREYGSTTSLDMINENGTTTDDGFFSIVQAYRQQDKDQRAPAPSHLQDILQQKGTLYSTPSLHVRPAVQTAQYKTVDTPPSLIDDVNPSPKSKSKITKSKDRKPRPKSSIAESSSSGGFMKKIRGGKNESLYLDSKTISGNNDMEMTLEDRQKQKAFIHFDTQSAGINIADLLARNLLTAMTDGQQMKKIATGASAASRSETQDDPGDGKINFLLQNCPYFRNELGGEEERSITLNRHTAQKRLQQLVGTDVSSTAVRRPMCNGVSVLDNSLSPKGKWLPAIVVTNRGLVIEYVDQGAYYYREFFHNTDHQNYFGIDDSQRPLAVSIKREFVDAEVHSGVSRTSGGRRDVDTPGQLSGWFQYRIIIRTAELPTLRGCVLEEVVPNSRQLSATRGIPSKEVLEFVSPELNVNCLKLATNDEKTVEQLMKLDELGLSKHYKIGVLYCRAGQETEEEMYNNEFSSPAFEEFLDCIATKVQLQGFDKYSGGLDVKSGSSGTHSYYTHFLEYDVMFHISTLLPFTASNRQQLLRKRHIGNDIVTIVFQEPGSLPFTPMTVRSQFQHVFIVVRVHNPNTANVKYSIGVSRSKNVPIFGPPLPLNAVFSKGEEFKHFLLTKVINAENAVHHSEKFVFMATRTRQEYLKDLANNHVTNSMLDSGSRISLFSLGKKKKEKSRVMLETCARGAIVWNVQIEDFGRNEHINCHLAISMSTLVLIDEQTREVIFTCPSKSVIGWTCQGNSVRLFYDRGEYISMKTLYPDTDEVQEITQRLGVVTPGAQTVVHILVRNSSSQLGLHVQHEGIVSEVEQASPAQRAGIKQGSRIVEVCEEIVATLTHQQMVDLLRKTTKNIKVVVIPPMADGAVRRGVDEMKSSHRAFLTQYTTPLIEDTETQPRFNEAQNSMKFTFTTSMYKAPDIYGSANYVDFPETVVTSKHGYQNSYDSTGSRSSGRGSDAPLPPPKLEPRTDTLSSEGFVSGGESLDRQKKSKEGPSNLPVSTSKPLPPDSAQHLLLGTQWNPPQSNSSGSPAQVSPSSLGYSNLAPRPYSRPKEAKVAAEMVEFVREPRRLSPSSVARHLSREDVRKVDDFDRVMSIRSTAYTDQHRSRREASPQGSELSRGRGRGGATNERSSSRNFGGKPRGKVEENLKRLIDLEVPFTEQPDDDLLSTVSSNLLLSSQRYQSHPETTVYRTKSEESLVSPALQRKGIYQTGRPLTKANYQGSDVLYAKAVPTVTTEEYDVKASVSQTDYNWSSLVSEASRVLQSSEHRDSPTKHHDGRPLTRKSSLGPRDMVTTWAASPVRGNNVEIGRSTPDNKGLSKSRSEWDRIQNLETRLAMLEEQLQKERLEKDELKQKVENLQKDSVRQHEDLHSNSRQTDKFSAWYLENR